MINKEFRKVFKEILGEKFIYAPEVKKILASEGITNRDGAEYSSQSIRNVFNGRENTDIELGIKMLLAKEIEKKQKLQRIDRKLTKYVNH